MKPALLLLLVLPLSQSLAAPPPAPLRSYPVHVRRAVDGDTLEVDVDLGLKVSLQKEELRLDGVNAPEKATPAGKTATAFVVDWLARHGSDLTFTEAKSGPREKFGRLLGTLRAPDGADLAADLLASGNAVVYHGGPRLLRPVRGAP